MKIENYKVGEYYCSNILKDIYGQYFKIADIIERSCTYVIVKSFYKLEDDSYVDTKTFDVANLSYDTNTYYVYKKPIKFPYEVGKTYKVTGKYNTGNIVIVDSIVDGRVKYSYKSPSGTRDVTCRALKDFLEVCTPMVPYKEPTMDAINREILCRRTWETISDLQKKLDEKDSTIKELEEKLVYYRAISNFHYGKMEFYEEETNKALQAKVDSLLVESDAYKRSYDELCEANGELKKTIKQNESTIESLNIALTTLIKRCGELNELVKYRV